MQEENKNLKKRLEGTSDRRMIKSFLNEIKENLVRLGDIAKDIIVPLSRDTWDTFKQEILSRDEEVWTTLMMSYQRIISINEHLNIYQGLSSSSRQRNSILSQVKEMKQELQLTLEQLGKQLEELLKTRESRKG